MDQYLQIRNECKMWKKGWMWAQVWVTDTDLSIFISSVSLSLSLPGCIHYWDDWSGLLWQKCHVSAERHTSTRTHTHIKSNAHAQTDTDSLTESLVRVAASLGRCYWKSRRSTTQCGASGRMRWPFVQSYWSACSWHTCSYDESTAGNNGMMSVCLFVPH